MKKTLFILLASFCTFLNTNGQTAIDISAARLQDTGSIVTIQGVATNGSELGNIRYIQDPTGGLPAFQNPTVGDFVTKVKRGDIVKVTGKLKEFNKLLEIDPISSYTIISSGAVLPTPKTLTPFQMTEPYEGQLIQFENCTLSNAGELFKGNTTYTITQGTQTCALFVRTGHPLVGKTIPSANLRIIGIASQFKDVYQLLPRDENDINVLSSFYIVKTPVQNAMTTTSTSINWTSNNNGTGWLKYGTDPNNLTNTTATVTGSNSYDVNITGLTPATFYYVQAVCTDGKDTVSSKIGVYSTVSTSSGTIRIFFNHDVDPTVAINNYAPEGTSASVIETELIKLIDAAKSTIDVSMYNCSRKTIINALNNAFSRGVRVRYIADIDTDNSALSPNPSFKFLKVNDLGLMHNKYFAIDANSEKDSWLVTGSMNFTDGNMIDDFNNTLFIQDQAIVKNYELETDEMWGGKTASPNPFTAKSGSDKSDNTPHKFIIGGTETYCYFSPSDGITGVIADVISKGETDLRFALLTFTQDALGTALKDAEVRKVDVRGMIENINDQGSEYQYLLTNKVDVKEHTVKGLLHHKYILKDVDSPTKNIVLTGSHNWSASAETRNDENTLVLVGNQKIANLYKQEFEQRWKELTTGLKNITPLAGVTLNFNNPSNQELNLSIKSDKVQTATIYIFSIDGKMLQSKTINMIEGTNNEIMNISGLSNGTYLIAISNKNGALVQKAIIQH